ncbi:MAG: NAD(P)-dependent oxidoreductase [Candidatus Izemoplasmataceae bacterium]
MRVYSKDSDYIKALELMENITPVSHKSEANIIVSGRFTKDDYHEDLKAVIVPYTGLDGIDIELLKKHKVMLFNTTVHSKFVAEKALTLLLSLLGNVINYHNDLKKGFWGHRNSKERTPWVSLFDKTIGIYGYGRIGQIFHELIKPFNPSVHILNRHKSYPDDVTLHETLESLAKSVEILVIATPLNESTYKSIHAGIIDHLQDGIIVNVGRGNVIDEEALYKALANNHLKGFASDVWFEYPKKNETLLPSIYPIHSFSNVVMTPHCGGFTTTSKDLMIKSVLNTIQKILNQDYSDNLL